MTRMAPQPDDGRHYVDNLAYLLDELRRIDLLIHLRLLEKQSSHDANPLEQFKGLVLLEEEILQLVAGPASPVSDESPATANDAQARILAEALTSVEARIAHCRAAALTNGADILLGRLSQLFGLTRFDEECLLFCLAAEIDRKYEKVYGYLQDDVTQKSPGVDLLLGLLCKTTEEKVAARSAFDSQAPLLKYRLLQVNDRSPDQGSPLISRSLKLDDRIASFLLGSREIDARLDPAARLASQPSESEPAIVSEDTRQRLVEFFKVKSSAVRLAQSVVFSFSGPYGAGKRAMARAVCRDLSLPLLVGDVSRMVSAGTSFADLIWLLGREAALNGAALCLENIDPLLADHDAPTSELKSLCEAIRTFSPLTFLIGRHSWPQMLLSEANLIRVDFTAPDAKTRKRLWQTHIDNSHGDDFAGRGSLEDGLDTEALAGKFRLTPGQIRDAFEAASSLARWRSPDVVRVTMEDLYAACRAQTAPKLGELARKIKPRFRWEDIVLPPDQLAQLTEICNESRHRQRVYGEWGFDGKLSLGRGLTALFTGPPGTGKTMAAEVVANGLNLDLYKIDLSQVVSKYIGETEKKLHQIFDEAQSSNSILFFDEADALFGKRSEVKDAHDRYANIEVGYLLQKMEEYDGIAILATNLQQNMDDAFTRRMRFIVEFPFPDEHHRKLIWQVTFPTEAPLGDDVDLGWLARGIRLPGGNIKNIALAAAFFAAGDGGVIRMSHLIKGGRREFQKIGRKWSEEQAPQSVSTQGGSRV
ncbi:MAG TPA: AAA family ATPase [Blastocatellia bacterium]|nr:AAA family ATPase [Blastocatellia bacterium]